MTSKNIVAAIELIGFVAFALILKEMMDPYFWRYSGPVSLITTVILLTVYLRMRGQNWASMGLRSLPGTKAKLLLIPQAILVIASMLVVIIALTKGFDAMGIHFLSDPIEGENERWGDLEGNLQQYLILIALSWISAGLCEEMFFRGFVITRLQDTLGGAKFATAISIILAATLFGYVHFYYQGLAGFVNAGVIGLIYGTLFFVYKRNLWPLVIAHGFVNSLGFTVEYLGLPA